MYSRMEESDHPDDDDDQVARLRVANEIAEKNAAEAAELRSRKRARSRVSGSDRQLVRVVFGHMLRSFDICI